MCSCFCFPCSGKQVRENPGFLQLRKIDAAVKVANTISTSANRVFLDSNALLLNVNDITLRYSNADESCGAPQTFVSTLHY
jgi:hypothetical protein